MKKKRYLLIILLLLALSVSVFIVILQRPSAEEKQYESYLKLLEKYLQQDIESLEEVSDAKVTLDPKGPAKVTLYLTGEQDTSGLEETIKHLIFQAIPDTAKDDITKDDITITMIVE